MLTHAETAHNEQVTEPLFPQLYLHLSTVHRVRQGLKCFIFASLHKVWKLLEHLCTNATHILFLEETDESY